MILKRTKGRLAPIDRHLRGNRKKGENYLKQWDQFITFLMILLRHDLI